MAITVNSWLTVNPTTGSSSTTGVPVSLTASVHKGREARTASFKVTADNDKSLYKSVTVTQNAADIFMSTTGSSAVTLTTSDATTVTIPYKTNAVGIAVRLASPLTGTICNVSATTASVVQGASSSTITEFDTPTAMSVNWSKVFYKAAGGSYGKADEYSGEITISIPLNSLAKEKVASLSIVAYDGTESSATATGGTGFNVKITQPKAGSTLSISPSTTPSFDATATTASIKVISNDSWTITAS